MILYSSSIELLESTRNKKLSGKIVPKGRCPMSLLVFKRPYRNLSGKRHGAGRELLQAIRRLLVMFAIYGDIN